MGASPLPLGGGGPASGQQKTRRPEPDDGFSLYRFTAAVGPTGIEPMTSTV